MLLLSAGVTGYWLPVTGSFLYYLVYFNVRDNFSHSVTHEVGYDIFAAPFFGVGHCILVPVTDYGSITSYGQAEMGGHFSRIMALEMPGTFDENIVYFHI
ncbi:hypothetical protein NXW18_02175 [Bacteroides thetaiotaomicron]|jgi:hypothetical protein|uniref:hypothetical protein n=1 Tax=Bacteroidaceae TaxID=815 RepID=UPI0003A7438C|nr:MULTISPECIES: hypothetical protein [Bacteroidaceae]MCS2712410.1 hypothetical protein [Bacteroides thetaiotaomicron]MCS2872564.1 hypothetical protein [Bacteroides thetaiotaomicron]MCS3211651.1 hypothetical protein [Bacteroides thetaiotaomicron]NUK99674.1 hypothetical protein [Phocaeicola sartorii]